MKLWREIEESLIGLRELFFPRTCCVCGNPLQAEEKDICRECFSDMPLTYFWDWEDNPFRRRLEEKCRIEHGVALFHFSGESEYHYLMHRIKFEGGRTLGFRLGYLLGSYMKESGTFTDIDAVVPVPLHFLRQFRRGYNQSMLIARGIASALGVETYNPPLERIRRTKPQSRLKGYRKSDNVKGAFRVDISRADVLTSLNVKHLLIVDDTLTTGATLSECVKILSEKFRVSAASLAFVG